MLVGKRGHGIVILQIKRLGRFYGKEDKKTSNPLFSRKPNRIKANELMLETNSFIETNQNNLRQFSNHITIWLNRNIHSECL